MYCSCGAQTSVKTAKTADNYGRRFIGCGRYGSQSTCSTFRWMDEEMCDRSKVIIGRLLRKIETLDREIKICREREEQYMALIREIESYRRKQNLYKNAMVVFIVIVVGFVLAFGLE